MDLGGTASWAGLLGSSPKGGHPRRVFPQQKKVVNNWGRQLGARYLTREMAHRIDEQAQPWTHQTRGYGSVQRIKGIAK